MLNFVVLRRQEWQLQQPLRAAQLHCVTKVEAAWPKGVSFWLASNPHPIHCYLITQTSDKSLHLLDPSHTPFKTTHLEVAPEGPFWAFCLPDGRLRIAELVGSMICWHSISLTPDSMVASHTAYRKHGAWLLAGSRLSLIHHARSGKVLSFTNSGMLSILAAVTLQETVTMQVSPRHPQHLQEGSSQLTALAWSHSGSMLAIWLQGPRHVTPAEAAGHCPAGPAVVSEVHVYDTSSGNCLQSIDVSAGSVKLCWSPGTDILAVYSRQEDWGEEPNQHLYPDNLTSESDSEDEGTADEVGSWQRCSCLNAPKEDIGSSSDHDDDSLTGVEMVTGEIRLLRPLQGQVHLLLSSRGSHSSAVGTL